MGRKNFARSSLLNYTSNSRFNLSLSLPHQPSVSPSHIPRSPHYPLSPLQQPLSKPPFPNLPSLVPLFPFPLTADFPFPSPRRRLFIPLSLAPEAKSDIALESELDAEAGALVCWQRFLFRFARRSETRELWVVAVAVGAKSDPEPLLDGEAGLRGP